MGIRCQVSGFGINRFRVSGVSAAAGRRSGQFDRKRNIKVSYELHGIGYKIEGAGRLHAIDSDSFRTRPRARSRESEFYR